ncbi:NAD(P)/FAD-dependent oxidoreductase [Albibacterium indicum]|uniref:NAD(P)/FAD-dependent oxidoreductase n=1 Tax=Albibacterium indicum TaxID=2292082 RepID=UPI000E557968|nr:FAD-dependent oxidoreductase [Pedobacter indicus]
MKITSFEPFWLVKNGLIQSYPSLKEDLKAEVLIVGGGITGSLIAHQCIADGYNTVLIDKREIAHGSTSATTSMLQYEIDVPLYKLIDLIGENNAVKSYKACYNSIDRLEKIVREIDSTCGFKKKESLYFAASKKDSKWLYEEFEARKKYGLEVSWLTDADIRDRYRIQKTYGGILSKQAASIDAFQFTHDILKYNADKGLRIFDKTDLTAIRYADNRVYAEVESKQVIEAQKIIYCTGYETTNLIEENFVDLFNTYAIVGEQNEDDQSDLNETLFWNTASPYIYMRTTDDNRLLIGGEDEKFGKVTNGRLIEKKSEKLKKYINKHLPHYDFTIDFSWAGRFGETKDGNPYIGEHKDFPNSIFVLGFGGNGITFSVIGMDIVSKLLKNQTHELVNIYRFGR